jgi:FkbM family methyltransferase
MAETFISRLYFLFAKLFFFLGYFPGSNRLQNFVTNHLPLRTGNFAHPLGFKWPVISKNSLKTYISSCEPFTSKVLMSRVNEISTFICVGANIGWYPLLIGTQNRDTEIFAFECNPEFFTYLQVNMLNNDVAINCSSQGISNKESLESLFIPVNGNDGMSTLYPAEDEISSDLFIAKVKVTSLDSFFEGREFAQGEVFILMDIEGGEIKALEGAMLLIGALKPTLILEINPKMLSQAKSNYLEMFRAFQCSSYDIYWIDERENLVLCKEDLMLPHTSVLPKDSGANYLFVNHEKKWVKEFIK